MRGHVWTDVDNARSGGLPFVFEPGMGFERYVDYAMDVPMYFVYRCVCSCMRLARASLGVLCGHRRARACPRTLWFTQSTHTHTHIHARTHGAGLPRGAMRSSAGSARLGAHVLHVALCTGARAGSQFMEQSAFAGCVRGALPAGAHGPLCGRMVAVTCQGPHRPCFVPHGLLRRLCPAVPQNTEHNTGHRTENRTQSPEKAAAPAFSLPGPHGRVLQGWAVRERAGAIVAGLHGREAARAARCAVAGAEGGGAVGRSPAAARAPALGTL